MQQSIKPCKVWSPPRAPFLTTETIPDTENGGLKTAFIVNVPLTSGTVQCDLEPFNRLMDEGFSCLWFLHSNGGKKAYVRVPHRETPNRTLIVSRLLVGGRRGTHVRYVDGSPLNLRLSNLRMKEGFSKGHETAAIIAGGAALPW